MAQTQNRQNLQEYYTFVYCDKHKEGFMIKGHHENVPDAYMMSHLNECDKTSWLMAGIIHYDGSDEVKVIKSIRLTYNDDEIEDGDGKCFRFLDYRNLLTDEIGEKISIPTNSPLYEWFNTIDGE
jgi:hypothetical protein